VPASLSVTALVQLKTSRDRSCINEMKNRCVAHISAAVQSFIAEQWVNVLHIDFRVWSQHDAEFLLTLCRGLENLVPLTGQIFELLKNRSATLGVSC
jgi:hypothetical protein